MRTRRRATIEDLRLAIQCLPRGTRVAMLEGIRANEIIVGAYSNHDGICPMLAAHRAGGRTSCIAFARAWDRFTLAGRRGKPRRATRRELLILATHLEGSLLEEEGPAPGLAGAIAEHRQLVAQRPVPASAERRRPGDRDRSGELKGRGGWAWTRVFRRYDEYERALERLDREARPHDSHDSRDSRADVGRVLADSRDSHADVGPVLA
jgi:hypothetical protein